MSYCRFENTLSDLEDCKEVLDNGGLTEMNEYDEFLSDSEFDSAIEMIERCREITAYFEGDELDDFKTNWEDNKAKQERKEKEEDDN